MHGRVEIVQFGTSYCPDFACLCKHCLWRVAKVSWKKFGFHLAFLGLLPYRSVSQTLCGTQSNFRGVSISFQCVFLDMVCDCILGNVADRYFF